MLISHSCKKWSLQYLKTPRVNGKSPDNCNQSPTASIWERLVGVSRVIESVDQSSGVDRANSRHPRQMEPSWSTIFNLFHSSYGAASTEEHKIWEAIYGGNFRMKGLFLTFNRDRLWRFSLPPGGSWAYGLSSLSSLHSEICSLSLSSSVGIWRLDPTWTSSRLDARMTASNPESWLLLGGAVRYHVRVCRICLKDNEINEWMTRC